MNTKLVLFAGLAAGLALPLCPTAEADILWTATGSSGTLNEIIPDGNLSGLASSITLNSLAAQQIGLIQSVTVTVDVTGDSHAWDGDYYAYLEYNGTLVTLLNRLGAPGNSGYGAPGNGFDITFSDAVGTASLPVNLHSTAPVNGTYLPVGNLDAFNNPVDVLHAATTGAWTLFIADESPGGVGELQNWSLEVTGLPDSGSTLLLLTMSAGLLGLGKYQRNPSIPAQSL